MIHNLQSILLKKQRNNKQKYIITDRTYYTETTKNT